MYHQTYQFHGDRDGVEVLSDAVVGVVIGSDAPIGIGIAHGWRKRGEPMIVTSSSGGQLYQLDGEPALDVYLRRVGAPTSLGEDPEAFRSFALRRPLGLSRRSGEDIRVIHGAELTDGSVTCLADVPQGALAWQMEADLESIVAGATEACAAAVAMLGDALPPQALTLDIAETALIRDPDNIMKRLRDIKRLGVRLAIDDFGTGYSSLASLHRFPIDQLKIDETFIDGLATTSENRAIVHAVVELARSLELQTVAEGIEHDEQLEELDRLGCQLGQGYHFARPLDPQDVSAHLARHHSARALARAH